MTTATFTNPSTIPIRNTSQEVIIFPNGSVLYGEDVIKQVDVILGGVRATATQQELNFLKNGALESVLNYTRQLYKTTISQ